MNLLKIYKQIEELELQEQKVTMLKIGMVISFIFLLLFYIMMVLDFLFLIVQYHFVQNSLFNISLFIFGFFGYPSLVTFVKSYFDKKNGLKEAKKNLHHLIIFQETDFLLELDFVVNFCLEKSEEHKNILQNQYEELLFSLIHHQSNIEDIFQLYVEIMKIYHKILKEEHYKEEKIKKIQIMKEKIVSLKNHQNEKDEKDH